MKNAFDTQYERLNLRQREAVDSIEGPVMVIAGPGTGKTQVIALRIGNILTKTDTPADGVLCLTFTNSGVRAMRERLHALMGAAASRVTVSTFHSFGLSLIEEFYGSLGFDVPPTLLDDRDVVLLYDELLENNDWQYLRTRNGGAHNFHDLKSLISFLKRENIHPDEFMADADNELKKTKDKSRIKSLSRTKEAGRFYALYETVKRGRGLVDYDDVLEYTVELVRSSENARDTLRERYLYVLVDEHQDSSGVQNQFIEAVWGGVDKPNLFVVGDDRQLIFGFGGASLEHFSSFQDRFRGTKVISLVANYRSTQAILDAADRLLGSAIAKDKLQSQSRESHPLRLVEAAFPRDEILAAGLAIKDYLRDGGLAEECAILVPKNREVRSAVKILSDLGLPVASGGKTHFFEQSETQTLIRFLRVLADPLDPARAAQLALDPRFGLDILEAHKLIKTKGRELTAEDLGLTIFESRDIYETIQRSGKQLFFDRPLGNQSLMREIEVVRTMLHLALSRLERDPQISLAQFVEFISRLEEYGEDLPLAVFSADKGVKVMTMHTSKGLEFDFVWIGHLDEKSLMKGRAPGFTLPERYAEMLAQKDEITAKRELFVAMTRAERFCTLSYAREGYTGGEQMLASIIAELPVETFERLSLQDTEAALLAENPSMYAVSSRVTDRPNPLAEIQAYVAQNVGSISLAVTHLNNFFSCPWKWYFRNFLRLPEPESESLVFGDLVHRHIDEIIRTRTLSVDGSLDKDAQVALDTFVKRILPGIVDDARSEASYRAEVDGVAVTGKLDLVEMLPDGTVRVSDFKTGTPKSAYMIEKRENGRMSDLLRQLATYDLLVRSRNKSIGIVRSRLLFLESVDDKNFIYETEIGPEETQLLRKDIQDFKDLTTSGGWVHEECHNQGYGRVCEYCALKDLLLK